MMDYSPKGMCKGYVTSVHFCKIADNILETVQDKDIVTVED